MQWDDWCFEAASYPVIDAFIVLFLKSVFKWTIYELM